MLDAVIKESSEIWAVFGFYAAKADSFLPTFRDMSVASSEVLDLTFEGGADRFFPKRGQEATIARCITSQKSTDFIYTAMEV
jgi:hypothetical protein